MNHTNFAAGLCLPYKRAVTEHEEVLTNCRDYHPDNFYSSRPSTVAAL